MSKKECLSVNKNPYCPYIVQINNSAEDIKEVKTSIKVIRKALLGESDTGLESGIVNEITKIKASLKVNTSWINFGRPIIIAAISSALTFLITTKII